jgi:hypothetical protein
MQIIKGLNLHCGRNALTRYHLPGIEMFVNKYIILNQESLICKLRSHSLLQYYWGYLYI